MIINKRDNVHRLDITTIDAFFLLLILFPPMIKTVNQQQIISHKITLNTINILILNHISPYLMYNIT